MKSWSLRSFPLIAVPPTPQHEDLKFMAYLIRRAGYGISGISTLHVVANLWNLSNENKVTPNVYYPGI